MYHKIKMESQAVFKPKLKPKCFLLNCLPGDNERDAEPEVLLLAKLGRELDARHDAEHGRHGHRVDGDPLGLAPKAVVRHKANVAVN